MKSRSSIKGPRYYGCHVSASGGLANALRNAMELEINTIQLHASPPQRWNFKLAESGVEDEFLQLWGSSGVEKAFFHGIYLINLASPDAELYKRSQLSLINSLDLMSRIKGDGVIFHMGSLKDEADEKVGFARVSAAINHVLEKSKNRARLILEVAAGSGKIIGDRLEELAEIYEEVEDKERVGFGLDSQHMWASGYDFQTDLDQIIKQVDKVMGLEKVWSIHLNDSKTELGSRKDRHENFGDGLIGKEALAEFFLHPRLSEIPFILETPSMKSLETAREEVAKLRALVRE